jgi:nicotinate-nucleotide pyrophosphorylase (carboxylating)
MPPDYISSPPNLPRQLLLQKFYAMLDEDIGFGDVTTTALISRNQEAKARLFTRQPGVVAGIDVTTTILEDLGFSVIQKMQDGSQVEANTTLLEAQGRAVLLLSIERTLLNLLQRMSGIATATANLVQKARKINPKVRIAATRKTAPLLRLFDKLSVIIGGGDPHRWRLDDAVLIKDNHLAFFSNPSQAIQQARENVSFTCPIEIEVTTPQAAKRAAKAGANIILFDNMEPKEIAAVVEVIRQTHPSVILEASGNITPNNIEHYANTGVDVISVGWLTHSVQALDLSIDITPIPTEEE